MNAADFIRVAPDVKLGRDVRIFGFVNLYGCTIGDETKIGAFVEIQKNSRIGSNCKVSSHTFICEGVTIEDNCFIGHGVMFINDKFPRATVDGGTDAGVSSDSPRADHVAGAYADGETARRLLGWQPKLSIEQAISDALKWGEKRESVLGYK